MAFYMKGTDTEIRGTIEIVECTYPITRSDRPEGWEYSGAHSYQVFDEGAAPKKDPATGETLFLTRDGDEVPLSQIEWRDE